MERRTKYTAEQKLWAVNEYLSGNQSARKIAKELGMGKRTDDSIRMWAV